MKGIVLAKAVGSVLAVTALGACEVHGRTRAYVEEPVSTVEVTSAPVVEYDTYPHTVYEGRTVYWVHDRWGYPRDGRWVYYRSEPAPLARYRTTVQAAPPARRSYARPAPITPQVAPPVTAPPAYRTR
jgi:hypothetical protein